MEPEGSYRIYKRLPHVRKYSALYGSSHVQEVESDKRVKVCTCWCYLTTNIMHQTPKDSYGWKYVHANAILRLTSCARQRKTIMGESMYMPMLSYD